MLNSDEERTLAFLEESLREPAWRRLARAVEGPVWRHRWKVRALFAFGVLVWVCGGVTGSEDVTYQGFLITTAVTTYWLARFMGGRPDPPHRNHRSPRRPGTS